MTRKQTGFSLLELLVAMTILAVLATVGFREFRKHSAQARYLKAQDDLKHVGEGLDRYYLAHGSYPDLSTWEAMVSASSPLVKENLVAVNTPGKDPWGQPYEGTATKGNYTLKSQGDPANPEDFGPLTREPGKFSTPGGTPATPAAGGPAK